MKKLLIALMCLISTTAIASVKYNVVQVKDTSGVDIDGYLVAIDGTLYTDGVSINKKLSSKAQIYVQENADGGAGDMDISAQYSIDGVNYFTVDNSASGSLTADSVIVTGLGTVERFIEFTSHDANFIRFYLDPDAASKMTLKLMYQGER